MARRQYACRGAGMSATDAAGQGLARDVDPYLLGHGGRHGSGHVVATGRGAGGPASKAVVVAYGFWLFLLSDIVLFSCLFAAHAVLQTTIAVPEPRRSDDQGRIQL